jgi:hypothetical protein
VRLKLAFLVVVFSAACGRTPLEQPFDAGPGADTGPTDAGRDAFRPDSGPCATDFDCDDGVFCNGSERCFGGLCQSGAPVTCDDGNDCTTDGCNAPTDTCFNDVRDRDGDGFRDALCGGNDCDDLDRNVNPGRREICDNFRDDDCNGRVDCEDGTCRAFPGCVCMPTPEICNNGIDDDCDTLIDCIDPSCAGDPVCTCIPRPERCSNGLDDDCDLLIDCADPNCFADPVCRCVPVPEVCGNMIDDDCDMQVDCSDPDCALDPACCVPRFEICDNMIDDDCDMQVDCMDPSCTGNPACAAPCPDRDLGSAIGPGVATGSTVGQGNDLTASCAGMARSPDVAFRWRAPRTGRFRFDTDGSDYDTALHVKANACGGPELGCDDDSGAGGGWSIVTLSLTAGQVVVVVVDGWATASQGNYVLNISEILPETGRCTDGIDNDRDGLIDCADSDCRTDPACVAPCPDRDLASAVGNSVAVGTTVGAGNDLRGTCGGAGAPELAFSWTAPRTARYIFSTAGSSYDTVLYLRNGGCGGAEIRCNDNAGAGITSRITRDLTAGTRVIVVVDGAGVSAGSFVLNITAREAPTFCLDMIDNDADGATDCADSECAGRPECCVPAPEICTNMTDDDCDGLTDCGDPNCNTSPACCTPTPENCANAMDEDCDGLIDCVDPDCRLDPRC